jgi:hypothetical protein
MRRTHYYARSNLVFARDAGDVWALYRVIGRSYPGLSVRRKIELKEELEAFAYTIEADFQLLRVARPWSAEAYAERALTTIDPRHGHEGAFRAYIDEQRELLGGRGSVRPEVFLAVRLEGADAGWGALGDAWRRLSGALGLGEGGVISESRVEDLLRLEERVLDRTLGFIDCERAAPGDLEYLVRKAYVRGLGEPVCDANFRPAALTFVGEDGEERYEPYSLDLLRLHQSRVEIGSRHLIVDSELGRSYQALLAVGALPEEVQFPSSTAELLFAPLNCGFPVDASFSCRWRANREAMALSRKRKIDADQIASEEEVGPHGASTQALERQVQARELEQRLGASDRPPLLRGGITLAVAARSEDELEERVDRLRSEYGRVELHRPIGEQHSLFVGSLPCQRHPIADYAEHLMPDQWGAMVGTAITYAGSERGPYIGHGIGGGREPLQFDLAEACQQNRPPTVLLTGALGSGKTMLLELLLYQAFLQGSGPIVDIDPKGDHGLERIPGVEEHMEVVELSGEERYRGLLDPLRIAPEETREDLAYSFLTSILPATEPDWHTELKLAIQQVVARGGESCGEVIGELRSERATEAARAAGRALEVHASSGLAQLGFGRDGQRPPEVGTRQIVSLRIRNLVLPLPGTPRSEFQEEERIGMAILRLLGAYGLRLTTTDSRRHAVLSLDEAWALLTSSSGRALCERMSRMGRSMNVTPIFASQAMEDAAELEPLVGSYFAFGVEAEGEAAKALELLRLDPEDKQSVGRLLQFRRGLCYFRDFDGRCVPMQVELGEELLARLDTTPGGPGQGDRGPEPVEAG